MSSQPWLQYRVTSARGEATQPTGEDFLGKVWLEPSLERPGGIARMRNRGREARGWRKISGGRGRKGNGKSRDKSLGCLAESPRLSRRPGECLEPMCRAVSRQPWEHKGGGREERERLDAVGAVHASHRKAVRQQLQGGWRGSQRFEQGPSTLWCHLHCTQRHWWGVWNATCAPSWARRKVHLFSPTSYLLAKRVPESCLHLEWASFPISLAQRSTAPFLKWMWFLKIFIYFGCAGS